MVAAQDPRLTACDATQLNTCQSQFNTKMGFDGNKNIVSHLSHKITPFQLRSVSPSTKTWEVLSRSRLLTDKLLDFSPLAKLTKNTSSASKKRVWIIWNMNCLPALTLVSIRALRILSVFWLPPGKLSLYDNNDNQTVPEGTLSTPQTRPMDTSKSGTSWISSAEPDSLVRVARYRESGRVDW